MTGLEDCRRHLTQKQYYTLLDLLVVQYVINGGILLRQRHNLPDEYHVDIGRDDDEEDDDAFARHPYGEQDAHNQDEDDMAGHEKH